MRLPSYTPRFAHLAALWGYGVSQPVFSLLKGNPEFLVTEGASRIDTVAFAVALAFGPPLLVLAVEAVADRFSTKVTMLIHLVAVWFFGFTALEQVLVRFDPAASWTLIVPAVASYAGVIAYMSWSLVRSFLTVSVALPVVALLLFVTTVPLSVDDAKAADVTVRSQTPVVLVVFDEFALSSLMTADGSIDPVRYPGFARLAHDSTWYSRATTVYEHTTRAVPAILSGRRPPDGSFPTLGDFPDNIFTMLGGAYSLDVREPVTRLCPVRYCPDHADTDALPGRVAGLLHDAGLDYLYGALPADLRGNIRPRQGWDTLVDNIRLEGVEFVRSIQKSDPLRTLYFLHVLQPHAPWALLPSGDHYNDASVLSGITDGWQLGEDEQWRQNQLLVEQGLQRHLLQVGLVDRLVSKLLDRLKDAGIYDRSLVIVTADHGVSFRPGGWRRLTTAENISDIAPVPLFVKYPHQKQGREDRRAAETIDVLPTIADVLGIDLPWRFDGHSLRAAPVARNVRVGRFDRPDIVASPDAVSAGLLAVARRNVAWLGEGADSLYRIGPRKDLLGRSVAALPTLVASGARVGIGRQADLEHVHKASGYVPAHFLARISWDSLRPAENIAIAVNGRIAAVTRPFPTHGETWVDAMIDENLLHDGRNDVRVYAVRGVGKATRLLRLGGGPRL